MELIAEKQFPANYSEVVLEILGTLSMTGLKKLKVVGSSNIRSMLYAGDYDCIEKVSVNSASKIVEQLRDIVKQLRDIPETYVTDIKCGDEPSWEVIKSSARVEDGKILDFNRIQSKAVVDSLRKNKVITPAEAKEANELLDKATTPFGFLDAKKSIRFHVLRWKPIDIINGVLDYRGKSFVLEEAIKSGGMIKMDVVSNIYSRFTEFSCIYEVRINRVMVTSPIPPLVRGVTEDILYYDRLSPFKAVKRLFSLAKHFREKKLIQKLVPILNGDLGRLYQMVGDLKTLEDLLDRPSAPVSAIRDQIDDMRHRLGNIYQLKGLLSNEHRLIGLIDSILKTPTPKLSHKLTKLIEEMEDLLDRETRRAVGVNVSKLTP